MAAIIYPFYTAVHLLLLLWGIRLFWQEQSVRLGILLVITVGLVYDNLILSLGRLIGESDLLYALSVPRFLGHYLFTPLLIIVALLLTSRTDVKWADGLFVRGAAWVLVIGLITLGMMGSFAGLELEAVWAEGVLRYTAVFHTPPLPAIITILVTMAIGTSLWKSTEWAWLFAGTATMLLISGGSAGIPVRTVGLLVGSGGELLLILSFMATERWVQS